LGKVRCGIKAPNKSGQGEHPEAVDYFCLPPEIAEMFGDKPRSLPIMFPVEDETKFAAQFYKCYSSFRGLVCRGTGETCSRLIDTKTGDFAHRDTADTERCDLPCSGRDCPMYQQKKCKEVMNLIFLLPSVPGLGVWQLDTGSYHSIVAVNSAVELIRSMCGRIAMIPLRLTIEPREVTIKSEKGQVKKTVHVLQIRTDATLAEIQRIGAAPGSQVMLPPPDEEKPDLLYPEDETPEESKREPMSDAEIASYFDGPGVHDKPPVAQSAEQTTQAVETPAQDASTDFVTYVKETATLKLKWKVSTLASWLNSHRVEIPLAQDVKGVTVADLLKGFTPEQEKKTCELLDLKARG
jgi:hypothetical protein